MHIIYIGFSQPHNSVDGVYIKGLQENDISVKEFFFPTASWSRYKKIWLTFRQHRQWTDTLMVGFASPQAVIFLGLLTRKKIIYNALCSEYERKVVSRGLTNPLSPKSFYYWLLDFIACHLAALVMLESQHQINYFVRLFGLAPKKFILSWTGVDDRKFFTRPDVAKYPRFTVLFRGRLLPEAGGEYLVAAAKELENEPIDILMLAAGQELPKIKALIDELQPANLKLVTDFLPEDELRLTMQQSHLSLGQLGNHERLQRTIPHKAYESSVMKLPYLTARNPAVMELFEENKTCLAFNPADSHDLAAKIIWAKNHPHELQAIAANAYRMYQEILSSKQLAKKLLDQIKTLL